MEVVRGTIIFEGPNLPQQTIYHWKELSKFRPFSGLRKNIKLKEHKHVVYHFDARDLNIKNI